MDEATRDFNPLRIVEDEILTKTSNSDKSDNDSNGELFDFSASDIEELADEASPKRNSLQIVEEKDLHMDSNNNNNLHRLSLQVESGDENSLVMTNEAVNRTIIRIGSNGSSVDFGEADGDLIDDHIEAINHEAKSHDTRETARRNSENFANDDGEIIVSLLGQINDIVGYKETICLCP